MSTNNCNKKSDPKGTGYLFALSVRNKGQTQTAAAANLGVTVGLVNHLIWNRRKPSLKLAVQISKKYNIDVDLW